MYTLNKDAQAQCKTDLNALENVKARHVDLNFYYDEKSITFLQIERYFYGGVLNCAHLLFYCAY